MPIGVERVSNFPFQGPALPLTKWRLVYSSPLGVLHRENFLHKFRPGLGLNQDLNMAVQHANHCTTGATICVVNMFLNGGPYLIVNWVEVWAVWMSKIQRNKVRLISTQLLWQFHKCDVQMHHHPAETHLNGSKLMSSCKMYMRSELDKPKYIKATSFSLR